LRTTTLKTTALKKQLIYLMIIFPLLITACATGAKSERFAPEWFRNLEETEDESCYLVKISTFAMNESEASEKAVNELYSRVMEISGKSDIYSNTEDQTILIDELKAVMDTELPMEDILSIHRQEWFFDKDGSYYYGAFCLYKSAADKLKNRLLESYYSNDEILNAFLASSESYKSEQKYYSAAEELLKAALHVQQQSKPLFEDVAQLYIDNAASFLNRITVSGIQAPEEAFANTMIGDPFHILCSSEDGNVGDVEFLVSYVAKKRDGSKGQFERRLISNSSGVLEFYHPFIPFSGDAPVSFKVGSRDFHSALLGLGTDTLDISALKEWVNESSLDYQISVASASRKLPMGVILLHTDITGRALDNNDSSIGLAESLTQDGFQVTVMTLDPAEIEQAGESAFLRDLRAYYRDEYVRVVFGTVRIEDFESRGDTYRVKTGGSLKVVDVDSGEILMISDLEKSVESRSNTLAVTASFRELGKAFAQELIRALE